MDSDVPDSTDWLGTPLAGLMQVEQAFRCHVCKDLYDSPMITSCSHTFCSLCIRRSLSVDGKCPLCRANDQENKLRGNWALREAVDAFTKTRAALLQVARAPPPAPASPKRKAEDDIEDDEAADRKKPRMSTRRSKTRAAEATAAMMREEVDVIEISDVENADYVPDDGLVACPICWTRMKPMQVDKHIDTSCPGVPPENPTSTKAPAAAPSSSSRSSAPFGAAATQQLAKPPPERLPFLNYSILTDQALRKKLSALGVSPSGNRQLLERRHKEWVTLWNANCDSLRPKRKGELLQDLAVWERTIGAPAPSRSSAMGAQIKDKDFDGGAWANKHVSSYKDLIANARRTRSKTKEIASAGDQAQESSASNPEPPTTGVEQQPSSCGQGTLRAIDGDKAEQTITLPVQPQGDLYHAGTSLDGCDSGLVIVGGQPPQLKSVHDGNIQGV
ncbi:DNA repair protein rad18 [Gaeumannomyces tritici R3-111a-1]|uniref:Postreplication repair E3 ubiquitin-protein ligase RAD18 n=1 Tax=Gaeumannomyces tritici (strain R3-111a-1) TaxID=644352 RepID=J3NNX2_GAET3|nr:DNA repair protein rad18 [Gaeumannomyces tritici R3-111a-1]EJT77875.1 DNA repair protein rad18 [Gaeumannomyces tritici R3-111a-1]